MKPSVFPLVLASLAMLVLTGMDGLVKALSAHHSTFDILTLRYCAGSLFALALAAVLRPSWPGPELLRIHATRAIFSILSAGLFFYGIAVLPFAEVVAIGFLSPAVTALIARIFLGEAVKPLTIVSMAVSFTGVLVIAWDRAASVSGSRGDLIAIIATLASVLGYAISLVLLRARAQKDEMAVIVVLTNVFAATYLIVASFAFGNPVAAAARDWPLFLAVGGLGALGHVLLSMAYARAAAARVVAMDYTSFIWAMLIGALFFHEWPSAAAFAGAAMIVLGSLLLLYGKQAGPALVEE